MQRWVTVSINTQWYASDIAVNILTGTQLKAKECYSGQHVFKSWVAAELSTCHEHISYWIMSWSHYQLLVHHYHISHLQNFEHVMNTSVIGSSLSYKSFTELWRCHEHISHGSLLSRQSFTEIWLCHYISTAVMNVPLSIAHRTYFFWEDH